MACRSKDLIAIATQLRMNILRLNKKSMGRMLKLAMIKIVASLIGYALGIAWGSNKVTQRA